MEREAATHLRDGLLQQLGAELARTAGDILGHETGKVKKRGKISV
jgi:hypothetical protein